MLYILQIYMVLAQASEVAKNEPKKVMCFLSIAYGFWQISKFFCITFRHFALSSSWDSS